MHSSDTLYRRNRLLVYIIWGMLLLGIAVSLMTGAGTTSIIVLAVVGLICCAGATVMTFGRWLEKYVMYYIPVVISVLTVLMITSDPIITTYFLVYVNLAIMTLYNHFRAQLFTTLNGLAVTIWLFFSPYKEPVFTNNSPVTIVLYLAMIAVPLLASTKFSQRLQAEADRERENAVNEKNRTLNLMESLSESLRSLNGFSGSLKSNVTSTSEISRQVTSSFAEMASSIETQTGSISDIGESIRSIEQAVTDLMSRATELRALAENAARLTKSGDREAEELVSRMNLAQEVVERSAELMNELNEQNRHIRDIVAAIQEISAQTHLLSLNAAIEASRAGEQGRGFAVVADEIRKLAESSRESAEQIEGILETIRVKTDQAAGQVAQGQMAIVESRDAADRVAQVMNELSADAADVDRQSTQVESSVSDVHRQYVKISQEMGTIARLTEQNMAAVEEMAASMSAQDERIKEIKDSFLQLDELATELSRMSGR